MDTQARTGAFSRGQMTEMGSMGEGRGSREGPIPSTSRTWAETEQQGKQGQLASEPQR